MEVQSGEQIVVLDAIPQSFHNRAAKKNQTITETKNSPSEQGNATNHSNEGKEENGKGTAVSFVARSVCASDAAIHPVQVVLMNTMRVCAE